MKKFEKCSTKVLSNVDKNVKTHKRKIIGDKGKYKSDIFQKPGE